MSIVVCAKCGAKNRVDERVTFVGKQPVCGRCSAGLSSGEQVYETARDAGPGPKQDDRKTVAVTDATFKREVLEASAARPVLLDCWAPWCGPCRMIAPALEELAAESAGLYRVAKLNVDENPRSAARFQVQAIPTMIVFRGPLEVDQIRGAVPKATLEGRLSRLM